ncbi:hypothetical protein O6H91_13G069000 [Diphasiastrum complanatum]|uniref:Uncharacterized protein n=2 Tax=Diphasiastrum complanatum TaxID=34168 RepID=A0ACC2BVR5_DIPCM|nr:hypothetical protein O6H91_13G069000 [Diphasiastrum complanatum]KAJ7533879.1 hypothetical protein O6H91_13G069000 [Diphasiastrum complanatum]
MEASHNKVPKVALPQAEINWDRLDKTKFYLVGAGLFSALTTFLYPISVVKTRMQVATKATGNSTAPSLVRDIIKTDGIRGLYRGFGTVITGAVPSRVVFLTTLETTKAVSLHFTNQMNVPDATAAAISNGVAGLLSSIASQIVFVPIDVVSQRLMVQGTPGSIKYDGGLDAIRKIIKLDGIYGLYRGFGMSILTYSPSSAIWWATYGSSQRMIWRALGYVGETRLKPPSQGQVVLVQATGGIIAGAVSSVVTTPLDTIKTRLQVMEVEGQRKLSIAQTVRHLLKEDGWRGFYRGLGPRFVSMSMWGTSMIITYEYLKRMSVKKDE